MHIVIDARIISSSTGRYVERLLFYLQDVDKTNQYTVLVPIKDLGYWKPTNPNFTLVAADYKNYSFAEQLGFNRFLKKLKPDLVHFCMPQQPILYRGKKVTTFHDLSLLNTYNSDKNWLVYHFKQVVGRFAFKKVARDSDAVIAISEYTRQDVIKLAGIPEEKTYLTYEAAELKSVTAKPYKTPFDEYIMYTGQQSDYKNIVRLGEAHQQLLAGHPNLGLVLVGRKNAAALKNEAIFQQRGYKNIHFTDFIEDDQLAWLYTHTRAYVFPSLMEGFGLPGLEAMSYGAPVVSSNATCLPEIHGNAAHYFNPRDVNSIASAIDQVISDEKKRTQLSKAGYTRIKKFSWKKMAEETHAVYMAVLTNSPEQS